MKPGRCCSPARDNCDSRRAVMSSESTWMWRSASRAPGAMTSWCSRNCYRVPRRAWSRHSVPIEFEMTGLDQASTVSAECLPAGISEHRRHFRVWTQSGPAPFDAQRSSERGARGTPCRPCREPIENDRDAGDPLCSRRACLCAQTTFAARLTAAVPPWPCCRE